MRCEDRKSRALSSLAKSAELRFYINSGPRIGPAGAAPHRSTRSHWRPRSRPPAGWSAAPEGTDGRPVQGSGGPKIGPERPAGRAPIGGRTDGSHAPGGRGSEARAARRDGKIGALEAADIGGSSDTISTGTNDPAAAPQRGPEHPLDHTANLGSEPPGGPFGHTSLTGRASADVRARVVFRKPS